MEAAVESSPDLADALARIESMDLPVDSWAPDVLRHNDRLIDRDKLLKRTEERLESKNVDVASEIEMPKTPFFARPGHMLSLEGPNHLPRNSGYLRYEDRELPFWYRCIFH
jgi:hypothetical protein